MATVNINKVPGAMNQRHTARVPSVPYSPEGLLRSLPASSTPKSFFPWTEESPSLPPTRPDGRPWQRITIVTPSFNQGEFIEETIRSVLLQNYPNLEYIVMDGGSTDDTVKILEKYSPWISLWRSEKDGGQTHAINKGFDYASGVIRGYLNSDDLLAPGALAQVALLATNHAQEPILIMGDCEMCYSTEEVFRRWSPTLPANFVTAVGGDGLCPQPATFWTHTEEQPAPRLNESLIFSMDYDFWCQLIYAGYRPVKLDKSLAYYRHHRDAKGATLAGVMWSELAGLPLLKLEKVESFKEKMTLVSVSRRRTRHYLRLSIEKIFAEEGRRPAIVALMSACRFDPGLMAERPTQGLMRKLILKGRNTSVSECAVSGHAP